MRLGVPKTNVARGAWVLKIASVWRPEDEGLLQRLDNERLLLLLWRRAAPPGASPPHERATGLLHMLRESPEGERAAAAAFDGDMRQLEALLAPTSMSGMNPAMLHHLALFHGALARSLELFSPERSRAAYRHAAAAWIALASSGDYLRSLAEAVSANALPEPELRGVVDRAPLGLLVELAERARRTAGERSETAQLALRVLGDILDAVKLAGTSGPVSDRAKATARRLRTEILDTALEALAAGLDEAANESPRNKHLELFEEGVETWRWSDHDVELERFLIDRAKSIAWELYNAKRWDMLRKLCRILAGPVDAMAARIDGDAAMLPYAARCAQMFVFRAEMEPRFERQLEYAKRALDLCDTHRNGRLVYADLLAERALRTLERAPVWPRAEAIERARVDVVKAKELWPSLARVRSAEEALARRGVKV